MNSKQLFEIALGDVQPWFIEKIEFKEGGDNARELHLYLDFPKGSTFKDEDGSDRTARPTTPNCTHGATSTSSSTAVTFTPSCPA